MGKGQSLDAAVNYSRYSKSVQLGFTEPYFLDKPILLGGTIFRRDYNSFNFIGNQRNTTYSQTTTGGALRTGFPLTEFMSVGGRYSLTRDKITLDKGIFFTDPDLVLDPDGDGPLTGSNGPLPPTCDPLKAGRYLCDELGKHTTSLVGYSLVFDSTDGIHPTRGRTWVVSQDFAGLAGDVKFLRSSLNATQYKSLGGGWVFSIHGEGGYISPLGSTRHNDQGNEIEPIRLTDRFFGPQLRGFDIRGIGPRIQRVPYKCDETTTCANPGLDLTQARITDALGGRAYYMGRLELEFPINSTLRSLGLRPSAFVDAGSLFKLKQPFLTDILKSCSASGQVTKTIAGGASNTSCTQFNDPANGITGYADDATHSAPGFKEIYLGDSWKPRLSIGIGVNWTSPFGPLRIDLAKALIKQSGDDTKLFSFNVGTSF
jgi:outer membrane protein insertion porin family